MTSLEYYIEQIEQFISALTDDIESGEGTVVTQTKLAVYQEVLEHLEEIEQDPCEDAISREDALMCLTGEIKETDTIETIIARFARRIRKLPPVNPTKTGWIPVSERLPEDSELVLFSTKTDRVFEGRFFADNTDRQWYAFRDETFAWNNVVTAWMPLPEPYKAESEEV